MNKQTSILKPKMAADEFTVLMPVYNRQDLYELFDQAISSVYNNTILPTDTIVIVDGPVETSFKEKILAFQRIFDFTIYWLPINLGLTGALNFGLSKIQTEYTFRADGDDINLPDRFENQLKFLREGYDLVGGYIHEIDRQGALMNIRKVPLLVDDICRSAKYRNPFNHMSVAFRTNFAIGIGGYPDLYLKEDYGLWVLFIKNKAKIINLPLILVHATAGDGLINRRSGFKYIKSELDLQRHLRLNGVSGFAESIFFGTLRIIALSMPNFIKILMYQKFLRARPK